MRPVSFEKSAVLFAAKSEDTAATAAADNTDFIIIRFSSIRYNRDFTISDEIVPPLTDHFED
jgi:hypothetical protein